MTLQHTLQKIEERLNFLRWSSINQNGMEEIKSLVQDAIQEAFRETSVEGTEQLEDLGYLHDPAVAWIDGFNEAVRLQKERQDNYMK